MRALDLFQVKNSVAQEETQLKFLFRAYDLDEDGFVNEDEVFEAISEIALKDLPNMTERQLRDVISLDF